MTQSGEKPSFVRQLGLPAISGAIAVCVTNPLELTNSRLQVGLMQPFFALFSSLVNSSLCRLIWSLLKEGRHKECIEDGLIVCEKIWRSLVSVVYRMG